MKKSLSDLTRKEKSKLFNLLGLWLHIHVDENDRETGLYVWSDDEGSFNIDGPTFYNTDHAEDDALETTLKKYENIKTYEDLKKLSDWDKDVLSFALGCISGKRENELKEFLKRGPIVDQLIERAVN